MTLMIEQMHGSEFTILKPSGAASLAIAERTLRQLKLKLFRLGISRVTFNIA